ncbi:MAG: hypothetical protein C0406_09855 [Sideroxydans sp.]|nr:hypothetical protein [Sideroxydans sp.]
MPWQRSGQQLLFFSRSAWSLVAAAKGCRRNRGEEQPIVYLPDYFCNQSLAPLWQETIRLVFYPIRQNLCPDWPAIYCLIKAEGVPDAFVLVHYFGFPSEVRQAVEFCEFTGAKLLEDAAHVLVPVAEIGQCGWATFYSPHKLFPLPEGSILSASEPDRINLHTFSHLRWLDRGWIKWLAKRLLQLALVRLDIPWRSATRLPSFDIDVRGSVPTHPMISRLTLRLLAALEPSIGDVVRLRRRNYQVLEDTVLSWNKSVRPLFSHLPEAVCPYLFPLVLPAQRIGRIYQRLNEVGIMAQPWPDLPPEVKQHPDVHQVATYLRQSVLMLPVHQGISRAQIEFVSRNLHRILKEEDV